MTFEEATADPSGKIQAWDLGVKDGQRTVSIYAIGDGGAKQLAYKNVPEAWRETTAKDLEARGIARGETDFNCDFVWVSVDGGLSVYDSKQRLLEARGDQLTLTDGKTIAKSAIERIIAFAAGDYIERGVKAELRSGDKVDLVVEMALGPMSDPTYSRNELLFETEWAGSIASALGQWAGCGHENLI